MANRQAPDYPEDPAVAEVEAILEERTDGEYVPAARDRPLRVESLFWICACITLDDSPIWIIFQATGHGLHWCRVPDEEGFSSYADSKAMMGGHADPRSVLNWLTGDEPDPWARGGEGWGDIDVFTAFSPRLTASQTS